VSQTFIIRRYCADIPLGAMEFLLKDKAFGELVRAIRVVAQGGRYPADAPAGSREHLSAAASPLRALSKRERDVLLLMADGMTTKDIAERLDIGISTVETYRYRMKEKLGTVNLADLTRLAVCEGIVPLDPMAPSPPGRRRRRRTPPPPPTPMMSSTESSPPATPAAASPTPNTTPSGLGKSNA